MKPHKTLLPAHRETIDHSPQMYQTDRSTSVGQTFSDFFKLLQREALFGLQLLLAFSVSYTAVQVTRGWLSESGMIAPEPSTYSARVFWPENTLALFPKPTQAQDTPQVALQGVASSLVNLTRAAEAYANEPEHKTNKDSKTQIAVTPTPVTRSVAKTSARLHTSPLKNQQAYRWAAAKPRYTARYVAQQPRYIAKRPVAQAARRQPVYKTPARVAVKPRATTTARTLNPAVRPVQRVLTQDYRVSKLKSYDEYMSWVRRTLREYKGG